MLRLMRQHASSWLIKVLLGIIVVVFVFSGFGYYRMRQSNRVALVNDTNLSRDLFIEKYNTILTQYSQQFGDNLTEEMIKQLNIPKQAMEALIRESLQLQEAEKMKIQVTDEELSKTIQSIGAFQSNGRFSKAAYTNTLRQNQFTPEMFEYIQRKSMLVEKLRLLVTSTVKVSEPEARDWFNWSGALVSLDSVFFDPSKYKDIKSSDEEVTAFFNTNQDVYKTAPERKIRYLHFAPEAYKVKMEITEKEIAEYYERNTVEFIAPKTVEARHILLLVNQNAAPEAAEERRKEALDIFKLAKDGKDFAELAKEYSEGPTKDNGGYLGVFRKEALEKPFADKAFSMKAGEISEPVRTRFGWHIIKVETVNEALNLSLEQATETIRDNLVNIKSRNAAYDSAEKVFDISIEGDDLVKASEQLGHTVLTTDFFTGNEPVGGVKDSSAFSAAAFKLPVMEISDIIELEDGYCIMQVTEEIPSKIPAFETVKANVAIDLKASKQNQMALNDANAFLAALKDGGTMSDEADKSKREVVNTGFFSRNDMVPGIGPVQNMSEIFSLSEKKKWTDQAMKSPQGYYIVEFKERTAPPAAEFDKGKTQILGNLMMQKRMEAFEEWVEQLKEESEIIIEPEYNF